ncbi:MAG: hypothetical protein J3R72DRAFT_137257 [Linnemannia gamsii]|nr:MAG: hypothetical protein J3R72DRAFT_137257 [Linnemannia gamsii]
MDNCLCYRLLFLLTIEIKCYVFLTCFLFAMFLFAHNRCASFKYRYALFLALFALLLHWPVSLPLVALCCLNIFFPSSIAGLSSCWTAGCIKTKKKKQREGNVPLPANHFPLSFFEPFLPCKN